MTNRKTDYLRSKVTLGVLITVYFISVLSNCDNGFIDSINEDTRSKYPSIEIWQGSIKLNPEDICTFDDTQELTDADFGFQIKNTGEKDLELTNPSRVVLSDPDNAFSLVPPLPGTPITAGGSESFTLRFTPPGTDIYSATVTVENNVADNTSYSFTISGTGTATPVMGVPQNVAATDGVYTDKTVITWDSVADASVYYIYRNTTNSIPASEEFTVFSGSEIKDDTTATPGIKYYYWVKAWNSALGMGAAGSPHTGYRKLSPPTANSASNGTSTSYVTIQWSVPAEGGATSYEIYRSTSISRPLESASATFSSISSTVTSYNDSSAAPATLYYYWLRAAASSSVSKSNWSSSPVNGYRMIEAPSNVLAATDCWNIDVSWDSVIGATKYEVYASLTLAGTIGTEYIYVGETTSETSLRVGGFHYPDGVNWKSANTDHYFKVRAYNPSTGYSHESSASDAAMAVVCG